MDLVSLGLGVVAGVRRNGPVWPHAQRTAERRQHTCLALLPRQRIGSEVVAIDQLRDHTGQKAKYWLILKEIIRAAPCFFLRVLAWY